MPPNYATHNMLCPQKTDRVCTGEPCGGEPPALENHAHSGGMHCELLAWAASQNLGNATQYAVLVRLAHQAHDGVVRASRSDIARCVGLSERQVTNVLKALQERGLITRQRHGGTGKGRQANTYTLNATGNPLPVEQREIDSNGQSISGNTLPVAPVATGNQLPIATHATGNQVHIAGGNGQFSTGNPLPVAAPKSPPKNIYKNPPMEVPPATEEFVLEGGVGGGQRPAKPSKQKSKPKSAAKVARLFDEAWSLGEEGRAYAEGHGILNGSADRLFEAFKDHHLAKGSRMLDWSAAWRTWVRNHVNWNRTNDNAPRTRNTARPNSGAGSDGLSLTQWALQKYDQARAAEGRVVEDRGLIIDIDR